MKALLYIFNKHYKRIVKRTLKLTDSIKSFKNVIFIIFQFTCRPDFSFEKKWIFIVICVLGIWLRKIRRIGLRELASYVELKQEPRELGRVLKAFKSDFGMLIFVCRYCKICLKKQEFVPIHYKSLFLVRYTNRNI